MLCRILLLTDQPILIAGFESILSSAELAFQLYSSDRDFEAALGKIRLINPDILLIDFRPEEDFGALMELRRKMPNLKIVVWVHRISVEVAYQVMMLGARAILRKTLPIDMSLKCLQNVTDGEVWLERDLMASILQAKTVALSSRQSQLLALVSEGLKNKEISGALDIAESTVRMYLSRLFKKLGVKDRYELALYGMRNASSLQVASERQTRSAGTNFDHVAATSNPINFLLTEKPQRTADLALNSRGLAGIRRIVRG